MEHHVPREDVRDFLLVADVPDHLDPSGVVHVDATRAVLDWFCARHPDHPICLASASRQNTRRAWEAFGYAHLPREYARLRLLDLNAEPLPEASFTMHLTTQKASSWGTYLAQPRKMYTPRGHIWHRSLASSPSLGEVLRCPSERRGILKTQEPHLTIVVQ
ncbi:MAG: hypothetical protein UY81_C0070G0005 [Candidatus Giovannonibacteria bacterium GW2011_GWA2_53_7]|uniref:Uncharacterized protein n=1 Tax=Candidatus Giovannonibacteria bacterium GW2011_GWA2_53_7 TaxID=1618650 RepID=A0A0G1XU84_9BACT|nr:MAG: hypothetical protein UY81_C0070G0005 [Candidatus Giovannonibacteria bacterium GW2011_GWA2_53_7]